ncbi:MAG: hypothetical protein GY870_15050, partial [archaeon]|nr:hypothetical protein [archaeon]
ISFMLGTTAEEIIITDLYPEVAEKLKVNLESFYSQPKISQKLGYKPNPKIKTISLKNNEIKEELTNTDLLVNASPVGMYPKSKISPLDGMKIKLDSNIFVFDAVYNPLETKLLSDAKLAGCKTLSGINMLVNQGVAAFEWWTGNKPNSELMLKTALKKLNIS